MNTGHLPLASVDEAHASLQVIAREIAGELNEARTALEAFAERPDDRGALHRFAAHTHLACGALRLAEVYGGALLAEEMEHVARYVDAHSGAGRADVDGLDALMRAMEQLPAYVERVASGARDLPLVLLPLLNDLRAVRGGALLSEGTLLLLNLRSDEPARPTAPFAGESEIVDLARRLRPRFQLALLGWIRGEHVEQSLLQLTETAAQFEQAASAQPLFQLWWVVGAVLDALRDGGIEASVSVKRLLGHVDRELRRLQDQGEAGYAAAPPVELLNNLLYYIAQSSTAGPRVAAVRDSFGLQEVLAAHDASNFDAAEALSAPSVRLMKTVAAAIREDLTRVKDVLDIFVRKGATQVEDLAPQLEMLRKISDTLGVLGLGALRGRVEGELDSLKAIVDRRIAPDDMALLSIASALIAVEDSLDSQLLRLILPDSGAASVTPDEPTDEEFRVVQEAVLRECIVNMARIKEAITQSLSAPAEAQGLDQVPQLVRGITAGLLMLGKQRAVEVMERVGRALGTIVRPEAGSLAAPRLERLADAIVAIEYYMETLQSGRADQWHMLDGAEARLAEIEPGGARVIPWRDGLGEAPEPAAAPAAPASQPALPPVAHATPHVAQATPAAVAPPVAASPPRVSPAAPAAPTTVDPEFVQLFVEEARENITRLNELFPRWEQNPLDQEALRDVRRAFHTLKGSGRMVGAQRLGEFCWSVESLLNRVISQTLARSPEIVAVVRDAVAVMPQLVEEIETGQAAGTDAAGVMLRADALSGREATQMPAVAAAGDAGPVPAPAQVAATPLVADAVPPALETPATLVSAEDATTATGDEAGMDPVLREIFRKETAGHIFVVREFLERCAHSVAPYPVSEALYRACHTLSGIAKTAGARQGSKVAEPMEHYVRKLHDNGHGLPVEGVPMLADTVRLLETISEHVDESTGFFPEQGRLTEAWRQLEHTLDVELARLAAAAEVTLADIWKPQAPYTGEKFGARAPEGEAPPASHQPADEYTEPSIASLDGRVEETLPAEQDADNTAPHEALAEPWIVESAVEPVVAPEVEQPAVAPVAEHFDIEPVSVRAAAPPPPHEPVTEQVAAAADDEAQTPPEAPPFVPLQFESAPEPAPEPEESDFDADIAAIFGEEATELLEQADAAFSRWRRDRADGAQVTELKRLLHTLKGGARMAGIRAMGDVSHELESYLAAIESGTLRADAAALDVLQDSLDELHRMRELANCGQRLPAARDVVARIREAAQRGSGLAVPATPVAPAAAVPAEMPRATQPVELPAAPAIEVVAQETSAAEALAAVTAAGSEPEPVAPPPHESHEALAALPSEQAPVPPSVTGEAPAAEPPGVEEGGDAGPPPVEIAASDVDAARVESRPAASWQPPAHRAEPAFGDAYAEATPPAPPVLPGREAVGTAERQELARVDADLLDDLLNNAGEVSIFRARIEQQMTQMEFNLVELDRTVTRLREQLRKLEMETEAQILFKHQQDDTHRADFDPLELDRYSTIQQLSRALAESVSDVGSIEGLLENLNRDTQNLLQQQARIVTEVQNGLMRTRMVPFQRHAQRLTRLLRQAAQEAGKKAELIIEGASGELDRQVLERMLPPFEHMLRNSVVHGIEAPAERVARGKPETGSITMRLQREGAEVVIVVEDDGAGLNVTAIRNKARLMGLLRPEQNLTDEEALQLVLEPGFSTADRLTQQAGRGVGMDVVATEVKKLGGGLFIESKTGYGARFTIRLPFTLAITQALIVRVHDELFALPMATVEGVARLPRAEIERHLAEETPTFEYGGNVFRFQHLASFIGAAPSVLPETDVALSVILVRAGEHSTALVADELVGSREIVVKPVGPQIASIRGISGATILGDGRIVIIMDMGTLVRSEWRARPAEGLRATRDDRIFALVVDDSITVRRVTQRLLERNGMRVLTAKDGVEAMALLQDHVPDVILLDIEMPRMDGYEVATHVRNDARVADVPIIMITSRVGDKHRARAIELGIDDYLGKPYQESQLLDAIEPLVLSRRRNE